MIHFKVHVTPCAKISCLMICFQLNMQIIDFSHSLVEQNDSFIYYHKIKTLCISNFN